MTPTSEDALGVHIPERLYDDDSQRADICIERIEWLRESHKQMLEKIKMAASTFRPESKFRDELDETINLAETPPPDWPDEEQDEPTDEDLRQEWMSLVHNGDTILGLEEWKANQGKAPDTKDYVWGTAIPALEKLLTAYVEGELRDGAMNWEDVDLAFQAAKEALPGRYEAILNSLSHPAAHE